MRTPLAMALFLTAPALLRAADDPALVRARAVLQAAPVVDGHNDLPWAIRERQDGAARRRRLRPAPDDARAHRPRAARQGSVGGQFWSVYIPGEVKAQGYARVQLEQIDIARRVIAKYPRATWRWRSTADDVDARVQARSGSRSLLGMEGGHAIENSLGALRAYYDLGARYMTLTHNVTLDWADAAGDAPRHGGLTQLRRGGRARDEPAGHAGRPLARLARRRWTTRCGSRRRR